MATSNFDLRTSDPNTGSSHATYSTRENQVTDHLFRNSLEPDHRIRRTDMDLDSSFKPVDQKTGAFFNSVRTPMTSLNHEDWVLMKAVAGGDEAAANKLYDRFGGLVFKSSRQTLPTRAEAEDAVQEVFVRLWKTADRYDPNRAKLVTWVMLITRRHLIDRLRRKRVRPNNLSLEGDPAGKDENEDRQRSSMERDERRNLLVSRISELPALQQEVITRAYLQGFTLREVAEQLEAPLGTIKSALSRGLARLRDRLADERRNSEA